MVGIVASLPSSDPFFEKKKKNYDQGINSIYMLCGGDCSVLAHGHSCTKLEYKNPCHKKEKWGYIL